MKDMSEEKVKCSGCQADAKYRVGDYYSCGRHLTTFCDMHIAMQGVVNVEEAKS